MPNRRHEETNRKGAKARNFIDSKVKSKSGEPIPLSGDKFGEVWSFYDKDGNGFLERNEIDGFLKDFLNSSVGIGENVTDDEAREMRDLFLEEFDTNQDGKISMREMTNILPVEEGFFVMFRKDNHGEKGTDYMQIWKRYDRDYSGFIEIDELRTFLRDVVQKANPSQGINEERLNEYTDYIMKMYDTNQDGKLGLSELAKLLPPQENFVQRVLDKAFNMNKLSSSEIDTILLRYDRDNSGTLEGSELTNLARDILATTQQDGYYNASDVYDLEQALLTGCDVNHDGRIDRKELALILQAVIQAQRDGDQTLQGFDQRVHQGRKGNYILSYVPLPGQPGIRDFEGQSHEHTHRS